MVYRHSCNEAAAKAAIFGVKFDSLCFGRVTGQRIIARPLIFRGVCVLNLSISFSLILTLG
jgi:hypothetical protein